MKGNLFLSAFIILAFVGLRGLSVVCSGGGDSTPTPESTPISPITDKTGAWSMHDTLNASNSGDGAYIDNYTLFVVQSGNNLTIFTPMQFKVSSDRNHPSVNANWTWPDGYQTLKLKEPITSRIRNVGMANIARLGGEAVSPPTLNQALHRQVATN